MSGPSPPLLDTHASQVLVGMRQPAIALAVAIALPVPSAFAAPLRFAGVHHLEPTPGQQKQRQRAGVVIFGGESVRMQRTSRSSGWTGSAN